jgi:hypothetical protein
MSGAVMKATVKPILYNCARNIPMLDVLVGIGLAFFAMLFGYVVA